MLYLEDYLEMIEHLPQELRDRFTEMRELDLQVQNSMDSLEKKQRTFFSQCKRGELLDEAIDTEYQNMRQEYSKVMEDADEKVSIATQIHELVERYLRRLDSELFKFKCELEADNNGITEILEKRSLEMDSGSSAASAYLNMMGANQKENRYYGTTPTSNNHGLHGISGGAISGIPATPIGAIKENRYRTPKPEKRRPSLTNLSVANEKRPNLNNSIPSGTTPLTVVRPVTPNLTHTSNLNSVNNAVPAATAPQPVSYNLQLTGAASNAIAAAASQAIVATQQMQQGRRTASLKASYEAIHGAGGGPTEFWISRDITTSAASQNSITGEKKQKKKLNTNLTQSQSTGSSTINNSSLTLSSPTTSLNGLDSGDLLSSTTSLGGSVGSIPPLSLASLASNGPSTSGAAAAVNRSNSILSSSSLSSATSVLAPSAGLSLIDNGLVLDQNPDGEWAYDPNEPRYCTCNQVSYGDMVACDNDACPYEWFHYPCVGITQPPKGKWYCPKCTASMRRRGNRKN